MKFYEWHGFVYCDIFAEATEEELKYLREMFPRETINAPSLGETDDVRYYFFINTKIKKIAPMSILAYAFGGGYMYPPYGEEITDFKFNCAEYQMVTDDYLIKLGELQSNLEKDAASNRVTTIDIAKLKVFTEKWNRLFMKNMGNEHIFDNMEFPEEAWEAGLKMDAGKSFDAAYPDTDINNNESFEKCLENVTDIQILGNLIFSRWRWWNHWANSSSNLDDFVWFRLAFNRLQELIKDFIEKEKVELPKIIGFHAPDEEYGCFSNWYPSEFKYGRESFSSVEQFMMYHKVMMAMNYDLANEIIFTDDPAKAKALAGPKYFHDFPKIAHAWDKYSMTIVKRGLRAKFLQNKKLMAKLLLTGDALLAECAGSDKVWGIGININSEAWHDVRNWQGDNRLGRLLMELRSEFLSMQARNESLLFRNACVERRRGYDVEDFPQWQMRPAELARYPEYHNTIYAYVSVLTKVERDAFLTHDSSFADWDYAICTNMGGGLSIIGFYEMKQDIYDIARVHCW